MENKTVRAIIKHIDHRIDELKNNCYGMHQANKATAIRENNRILKFCQDLIKHKMETTNTPEIQIGDTVITRKFEDQYRWPVMIQCNDKEGIVTNIASDGWLTVHNWSWPPSAVEPVTSNNDDTKALNNVISEMNKQWEPKPGEIKPEWGKPYEFSNTGELWYPFRFIAINPLIEDERKYITMDGVDDFRLFKYIRPLQKSLREQISEILYGSSQANNKTLDRIMEVIEKERRNNER